MTKGIMITALAGIAIGGFFAVFGKQVQNLFVRGNSDDEDDPYWNGKQTYKISELVPDGEEDPFQRIREKIRLEH